MRRRLRLAVNVALRARNPYGTWGYRSLPNGEQNLSCTFWIMRALLSAERAGVELDADSRSNTLQFVREMTDEGTGRIGYSQRGTGSARIKDVNLGVFPADSGETLTAEGTCLRLWIAPEASSTAIRAGEELVLRQLPQWGPDKYINDFGYWLAGSELAGAGTRRFSVAWKRAVVPVLVENQRMDGAAKGTWDPSGAWCFAGGRVYATAMAALALQALNGERP